MSDVVLATSVVRTASSISPRSPCQFQVSMLRLLGSYSGTPVPHSLSRHDSTMVFVPVLFNNSDNNGFCSNLANMPGVHLALAFCFHLSGLKFLTSCPIFLQSIAVSAFRIESAVSWSPNTKHF